jgi:FkbM family methyltransferase
MPNPIQDSLRDRLLALLDEPLTKAQERERTEFDSRVGSHANRLLLFGASNLGRHVLSRLRQSGQEPIGFIDNNSALWGHRVEGVEVFGPAEAARRFDVNDVAVLVTIWSGHLKDRMSDRIGMLRSLGFRNIALFGHLAWKQPEKFLPHYSLDLPSRALMEANRIVQAFDLFQDQKSREMFVSHVDWRLTLDYDALPPAVNETIYFNDNLIRPSAQEFLIDGGAFDGDTIQSFLETFGRAGFRRVLSFEPDPNNFPKLREYVSTLPLDQQARITALPGALGAEAGSITVETSGGSASRVGHGNHEVRCHTVDAFRDATGDPTFIKLDIEGYEPQALQGAAETLRNSQPVITVCLYHLQNHLWQIPLQIAAQVPGYRYTLVPHLSDGWDLVLYAVPPNRTPN